MEHGLEILGLGVLGARAYKLQPRWPNAAAQEASMDRSTCTCGAPILRALEDLGCIECGQPCCPVCAYILESVAYCASCATQFLDMTEYAAKR